MTKGISTIHVRVSRHHVVLNAMGQTNTGQKYLKQSEGMEIRNFTSPLLKAEIKAAVDKVLG